MRTTTNYYKIYCSLIFLCSLFLFTGCSSFKSSSSQDEMPALSNTVGSYSDIELPAEMKWTGRRSMAINTDSFSGGILEYSGRVEINSLKDYIISSMKKHGWRHAGEATYSSILLAFTKPNKTCMAVLDEGIGGSFGYSYVTFYVASDKSGSRGSRSYDEPRGGDNYGQNPYGSSKGGDKYSSPKGGDSYGSPKGGDSYGSPKGGDSSNAPEDPFDAPEK
jgi:hypothetical protein